MLKRNSKILTAVLTASTISSMLATTTVKATSLNEIQAKLPSGYGLESGKVTKELLELKLMSVKDDVRTGNTRNLAKNIAKLKSYLEEAVNNKEVNEKEAKDIMNEINELDKLIKGDKSDEVKKDSEDSKQNEPNVNVKEPNNKKNEPNVDVKEPKKQEKLVKTGSNFHSGMLMQIGSVLSIAGAVFIKKCKK